MEYALAPQSLEEKQREVLLAIKKKINMWPMNFLKVRISNYVPFRTFFGSIVHAALCIGYAITFVATSYRFV